MFRIYKVCFICSLLMFASCDSQASRDEATTNAETSVKPESATQSQPGPSMENSSASKSEDHSGTKQEMPSAAEGGQTQGTVLETMDTGGYTYLLIKTDAADVWVAVPETEISTGQQVTVSGGMEMKNFHSKTLDRDFESILFASDILTGQPSPKADAASQLPAGHPTINSASTSVEEKIDFSGVTKADYSVDEIFAKRKDLANSEVSVRGIVVKVTPQVMGKNWLHLRDGTGQQGTNDLVVTTDAEAKVGDLVTVKGTVSADKDFGFGYNYDVLIENAALVTD